MMKDIRYILSEGLIGRRTHNIASLREELSEIGHHILAGSRVKQIAPLKREGCVERAMEAIDRLHDIISSSFKRLPIGSQWDRVQWEDELVMSFYVNSHEIKPGFFELAWPAKGFYARYSLKTPGNVLDTVSKADYLYSFEIADYGRGVAAALRRSAYYEVYSIQKGPLRDLIEECVLEPLHESIHMKKYRAGRNENPEGYTE